MLLLFFHLKIENLEANNLVLKLQLYTHLVNRMSHNGWLQKTDGSWMTVSGLGETKVLAVVPALGSRSLAGDMGHIPLSVGIPWFKLWDENHFSLKIMFMATTIYLRLTQWREFFLGWYLSIFF